MGCIRSKYAKVSATSKNKINSEFQINKNMSTPLIKAILNCDVFKNYKWDFENLVIEGAGTNGTVTIGAYKILEITGILSNIKRYIGSSSGSIMAAFAAVRMTSNRMEQAFMNFDMNIIKDDSFGVLRDLSRLTNQYGFYNGDALELFVEKTLMKQTGVSRITFKQVYDIYGTTLYITRANMACIQTEYLCAKNCPDMPVSLAVRQSSSIPLIFKALKNEHGEFITDGALGTPYPIEFFDNETDILRGIYNKKTLGLKIMDIKLEKRDSLIRTTLGYDITNLVGFIEALIIFQRIMIERLSMRPGYWERTITLESPGRSMSDFNVALHNKLSEIHLGTIDTTIALAKYIDEGHF